MTVLLVVVAVVILLGLLVGAVGVASALARDPEVDEPATLEAGRSHLRPRGD